MATFWELYLQAQGAEFDASATSTDQHTMQLYGRLTAELGDYRTGTRQEINRFALEQLREQIRLHDSLTSDVHDFRESIAKDNRNALTNYTNFRRTVVDKRADLVKSRRPTSSYVYSQAMSAATGVGGSKSAMADALIAAYKQQSGTLGRIPDVQLYSILSEIGRAQAGTFVVDANGDLQLDPSFPGHLGGMQESELKRKLEIANAAQRAYANENRALDQSLDAMEDLVADYSTATGDQRDELASQLSRQLAAVDIRMMQSEGLMSKEAAQERMQKIKAEDDYYRETASTLEYLGEQIRASRTGQKSMKDAIGNEHFRAWAEANDFSRLGFVQEDGTYVAGKDDMKAVLAFQRQTQKPNRYGRAGSLSATTGDFITFTVRMRPEDAGALAGPTGKYAYITREGERVAITPSAAEKLEQRSKPSIKQVDAGGIPLLYDEATGNAWAISGDKLVPVAAEKLPGLLEADGLDMAEVTAGGQYVASDTGFMTAKDIAEGKFNTGALEYLDDDQLAKFRAAAPEIEYRDEAPQTYQISGEMMKPHAYHEINPALDDGYVEILTPSGKRLFKADEIVGDINITSSRSGTTLADVKWQRMGAAMEGPPGQTEPRGTERFSFKKGNITFNSSVSENQVRTNSFDDAYVRGISEIPKDEAAALAAAVAEREAGAQARLRRLEQGRQEELERALEMEQLEAAAASPTGGTVGGESLTQAKASSRLAAIRAQERRAAEKLAADKEASALREQEAKDVKEEFEEAKLGTGGFEVEDLGDKVFVGDQEAAERRLAEKEKAAEEDREAARQAMAKRRVERFAEVLPKTYEYSGEQPTTADTEPPPPSAPPPEEPSSAPTDVDAPPVFKSGEEELAEARKEAKDQRRAKREGRREARAETKEDAAAAKAKKKHLKVDARFEKDTALIKDKPKVAKRRAAMRKALSPRAAKALKGVTAVHEDQEAKVLQRRADYDRVREDPNATSADKEAAHQALRAAEVEHGYTGSTGSRAHDHEDRLGRIMYHSGRVGRQGRRQFGKAAKDYLDAEKAKSKEETHDEGVSSAENPGRKGLFGQKRLADVTRLRENRKNVSESRKQLNGEDEETANA